MTKKTTIAILTATAIIGAFSACGDTAIDTDTTVIDTVDDVGGDITTDTGTDVATDTGADQGWEQMEAPVQADCKPNSKPFPVRPVPSEAATLPFLHVDGQNIVDEEGNPVMLRGINFGSWLMMESWIAGIGILGQEELVKMMPEKAEEFGIKTFFEEAQFINVIDCSFQLKAAWLCTEEWRTYMAQNVTPALQEGTDNFWAWFDSEPWIYEERSLWKWFTKRFGYERMLELRNTYQDNYITEIDFQRAAELGINLIRLPFWYQALETDIEGENGFVEEGWQRLDQVLSWARKYKLYIMLDMHGVPGGQSAYWHQGLENAGQFWTNQACIDKTARLWQAIASYFKDEPHVAVLDLINEPNGSPDREHYVAAHDAIIQAIREVDTAHIVMMEDGFINPAALAGPAEMGWTNAAASFHDYPGGETAAEHIYMMEGEITNLEKYWERYDCPLFYGEFTVYGPNSFNETDDPENRWQLDAMDGVLDMMNRRGVHWAPWTWKYFDAPSLWGVYTPTENAGQRLDVKDTDFDTIKTAFENLNSSKFSLDTEWGAVLTERAAAAVAPLNLVAEEQPL
jgi:aryl-phospho-beta-D-glucosidase BglC (GH1 family)